MKQYSTLIVLLFFAVSAFGQGENYVKKFEYFEETRGDWNGDLILTLPINETVQLQNTLASSSGLGPTFNYYGVVVVVDQVDILPNGNKQLIIRREDGRDFYGYRPTLKAILVTNTFIEQP
ncbi:hypothetical protein [uncultured Croceitalea sp.]|uniref:hypothetical protein n=1 Tax=uncultured Croceitalea sp. TaxID=1798908 RepID=UPI0033063C19